MKRLAASLLLCGFIASANAGGPTYPINVLQTDYPELYKLYLRNTSLHKTLSDYAAMQGFTKPYERLATIVHELIHIDSAIHAGYFIDGVYYEPHVNRSAWPQLSIGDIAPYMLLSERGIIYRNYVGAAPKNHLGNVLDEINAYSHILEFVCQNEPSTCDKQVANLIGFLQLQEAYLRVMRTSFPDELKKMASNRESRGALSTISKRAIRALRACSMRDQAIQTEEFWRFMKLAN